MRCDMKAFVEDDKVMVKDEQWITIGGEDHDGNGKHVLINGEGTIVAGFGKGKNVKNAFGGKDSKKREGMKISKATSAMKGGKFKKLETSGQQIEAQKKQARKIYEAIKKSVNAEGLEAQQRADKNVYKQRDKMIDLQKKQQADTKKREAAKETLSSARSKIKSAREANAYMEQRGTKVSKVTPDMVGGRFYHPKNESEVLKDIAKSAEKKYLRSGDKRYERGAEFTRKEQKIAERKASAAKSTLEKARPKIAERREAIRKYNEKNS